MIPIPKKQLELLEKNTTNFSLLSPRLVEWDENDNKCSKNLDTIARLQKKSVKAFSAAGHMLQAIHKRQSAYINSLKESGLQVFTITAATTSPFITGLGSIHPTETGMILDRNTGLPYLPANSIKGVLRLACAVNLAESNEKYSNGNVSLEDPVLVKYFGSESDTNTKQGQLVILDAYPKQITALRLDIMTPHFVNYYKGKDDYGKEYKQPVETETPVPLKFLTVKEGTSFVFRCAFIPHKDETCNEEEVYDMFDTAFERIGFGSKTAIGYGRFKCKEEKIETT